MFHQKAKRQKVLLVVLVVVVVANVVAAVVAVAALAAVAVVLVLVVVVVANVVAPVVAAAADIIIIVVATAAAAVVVAVPTSSETALFNRHPRCDPREFMERLRRKHGDLFRFDVFHDPTVVLCDYDDIVAASRQEGMLGKPYDDLYPFIDVRG